LKSLRAHHLIAFQLLQMLDQHLLADAVDGAPQLAEA